MVFECPLSTCVTNTLISHQYPLPGTTWCSPIYTVQSQPNGHRPNKCKIINTALCGVASDGVDDRFPPSGALSHACGHVGTFFPERSSLTHWGRATHICVRKLTIIGSDNGLSPGRRQAIIWTNARTLLIGPLGTNFSEILIGIQTSSTRKMHLKISSAKWRPCCFGLNELIMRPLRGLGCVHFNFL